MMSAAQTPISGRVDGEGQKSPPHVAAKKDRYRTVVGLDSGIEPVAGRSTRLFAIRRARSSGSGCANELIVARPTR
jgi:hypothetical protein